MTNEVKYKFHHQIFGQNSLIMEFQGKEYISKPFHFDVKIVSSDPDIELSSVVNTPCHISLENEAGERSKIQGLISECRLSHQLATDHYVYDLHIVPHLKLAEQIYANEVYLDKSIPEIVNDVLAEIDMKEDVHYSWALIRDYQPIEYKCQYQETNLNFLHRILEHEGIYYYFDHSGNGEKIVFSDNKSVEPRVALPSKVSFVLPSSQIVDEFQDNFVQDFSVTQQSRPTQVILRDYNDNQPSVDIKGDCQICSNGIGEIYSYGENVKSSKDAEYLSEVRSQELQCREQLFDGEGAISGLRAGSLFTLKDHFRKSLNHNYQILEVEHKGSAPIPGIAISEDDEDIGSKYRTRFKAIAADAQFRPKRVTVKPKIEGALIAKIDAEGEGEYAFIDEYGRYKVNLLFDRESREEGKASHWVRMSQPYTGDNGIGMHFPLRKGAEVLLTFVDGNPDLPVISGTVPNAKNISVAVNQSHTTNTIRTPGASFQIEDLAGQEAIIEQSPGNVHMRGNIPINKIFDIDSDDQSEETGVNPNGGQSA